MSSYTNQDFMQLSSVYPNAVTFEDIDKQSAYIRDIVDKLEGSNVSYETYKDIRGLTIFYDDMKDAKFITEAANCNLVEHCEVFMLEEESV